MKMAVLAMAAVAVLVPAAGHAASAAVGQPAPEFTLTDSAGKSHSLAAYRGRHVVLEWVNFECPFVGKHYGSGNMQKLQKDWTGQGVVWLSVNSSAPGKQGHHTPAEIASLVSAKGAAPTAYLVDPEGTVGRAYGARTTPHMYVIDPQGRLVYAGGIDDKPSADPDDIPGARNHVRAALEESLAGKPVSTPVTTPYGCSVKYAGGR